MKTIFLVAFLALPLTAAAQTTQKPDSSTPAAGKAAPGTPAASPQYGQGGSPHCDSLNGPEKDQCLKDEGAKTDSKAAADSAAGGASAAPKRGPAPGGPNDAEHAPTK
jgi:hypothetical protein